MEGDGWAAGLGSRCLWEETVSWESWHWWNWFPLVLLGGKTLGKHWIKCRVVPHCHFAPVPHTFQSMAQRWGDHGIRDAPGAPRSAVCTPCIPLGTLPHSRATCAFLKLHIHRSNTDTYLFGSPLLSGQSNSVTTC